MACMQGGESLAQRHNSAMKIGEIIVVQIVRRDADEGISRGWSAALEHLHLLGRSARHSPAADASPERFGDFGPVDAVISKRRTGRHAGDRQIGRSESHRY